MANLNVYIPYEDFNKLLMDSSKLDSVISILNTNFPDDTCQLIAIKSVLGIVEEEPEEPEEDTDDKVIPDTEPEETT